jgi:hypothetical protein
MLPASLLWLVLTSGVKVVISVCSSPIRARSSSRPRLPTRGLASRYCRANSRSCMCRLGVCSLVWRPRHATGRTCTSFWKGRAISYVCCIPGKPISLRKPRGLRAKTDHWDATTIARVLLSGEARRGYVPTEVIATSARISPPAYAPLR